MKRNNLIFALLLSSSLILHGQVPQSINYQAIARDQQGNVLAGQNLTVRIGILLDNSVVWQEDHPVVTSELGLFSLEIGDPDAQNLQGSAASFPEIAWDAGNHQLEVSVDRGSGFEVIGLSNINAVPYALFAADGPDEQLLSIEGSTLSISGGNSVNLPAGVGGSSEWSRVDDTISSFSYVGIGTNNPNQSTLAVQGYNIHPEAPLFEVRREDGFPVFAVYNDGVMVYVDDDQTKGKKGGFAVGGYSRKSKGVEQEYLSVSSDSVRIYVPEEEAAKGKKGGFAVGGYSRKAKGISQDLLFVNSDSTRVYVPNKGNDPGFVDGLQGGFAVTGYSEGAKGSEYLMGINRGITRFNTSDNDQGFAIGSQGEGWGSKYMELTPTNSFVGTDAGLKNLEIDPVDENGWGLSSMNVFVGYQSGMENLYGHHNTFLGFRSGTKTVGEAGEQESAAHNVFIGTESGFKNTQGSYNVYMGCYSGYENLDGFQNVFIGGNAGFTGQHVSASTMVGNNAGAFYDGDGDVTFLGFYAGSFSTGIDNTYLGSGAGTYSDGGSENVMVGRNAGVNATGSNNTFLGNLAGAYNNNGSGNVLIGNLAGANDDVSHKLYIDNTDTIYPLIYGDFIDNYVEINDDLYVYGTLYEVSDRNRKTNIAPLGDALQKVMKLNGVSFDWATNKSKGATSKQGSSIGVIAQDVETVLPALVSVGHHGEKAVNYSGLIPVLLEAIKEQQTVIETLEQRIAALEGN